MLQTGAVASVASTITPSVACILAPITNGARPDMPGGRRAFRAISIKISSTY